jgi:cytochrome c peroxidase
MSARIALFGVALLIPSICLSAPDAAEGQKLVQKHKCEACHQSKVYGPEGTIYLRKDRKVTSWAKLKAQVAGCSSMLNLGLFPEEEENVAAYLNQTYYKFPTK